MNIFRTIRNIFRREPPKDSYTLPIRNYPPLDTVTRDLLMPEETAFYLNLTGREIAQWEMSQGPIHPTTERVGGEVWVRFRTADVRRLAAGR